METAYRAFLTAYPEYAATDSIDALRAAEYARLDAGGHVYLDYTGGSLYSEALATYNKAGDLFDQSHAQGFIKLQIGRASCRERV